MKRSVTLALLKSLDITGKKMMMTGTWSLALLGHLKQEKKQEQIMITSLAGKGDLMTNSPGYRRLKAHPDYENIIQRTLVEQQKALMEVSARRTDGCTYPNCKCIVITATSEPTPKCPKVKG